MKIKSLYLNKFLCLFASFLLANNTGVFATDSLQTKNIAVAKPKDVKETIIKDTKLSEGQKKLASAFKNVDTSRIVKRTATFVNKNASRSEQDNNALSYGNFKVSEQLYGAYASYIIEYVKNYNTNFGPRMSRIKAANKGYFTMIDNTMRKNGIPKEMHSLAVIESALNPNATSPVGAVGPWQFMPATGQMLGLQVSETLDERRDFYKSTQAAAKFTKRLYSMFHDWLLVIAAYNCGPAPVLRHLNKTGGRSFWDIKQFLPKETQNHVMAFIATSIYYDKNSKVLDLGNLPKDAKLITKNDLGKGGVVKTTAKQKTEDAIPVNDDADNDLAIDADDNGKSLQQILPEEISQVITLKIKGAYNIESIATVLDFDLNKLRRWNPQFNEQTAVPGTLVKLTIPAAKLDAFLIQKDKILSASLKNPIAKSGNTIYINKPKTAVPNDIKTIATATPNTESRVITVKKEEPAIKKNNTITEPKTAVAKADNKNAVDVNKIEAKKLDKDPIAKIEKPTKNGKKIYTIKAGDNLNEIAEQFGMTVARLMDINKLKKEVIIPGHTLYLE